MRSLLGTVLVLFATSVLGQIKVENSWARPTPPNAKLAAGYLTVANAGAGDRLIGASSPAAQRVEMHITLRDGEILRMREVKEFGVPANSRLALEPAGAHLMFVNIKRPFKAGEKIPVTLKFMKAGEVKIELAVRAAPKPAPPGQHKH